MTTLLATKHSGAWVCDPDEPGGMPSDSVPYG